MSWPDRSTPPIFLLYATIGGGQGISLIAHPITFLFLHCLILVKQVRGVDHPVVYISQKLTDQETQYSTQASVGWWGYLAGLLTLALLQWRGSTVGSRGSARKTDGAGEGDVLIRSPSF